MLPADQETLYGTPPALTGVFLVGGLAETLRGRSRARTQDVVLWQLHPLRCYRLAIVIQRLV